MKLPALAACLIAVAFVAGCGSGNDITGPQVTQLQIEDLTVGTGAVAATGNTVTVRYVGAFLDGRQFDSGTFSFRLGASAVIPGFEQGILGMRVGGRRRVTIPSDLAYGAAGNGPIPPNTPLRFEIELLSVVA